MVSNIYQLFSSTASIAELRYKRYPSLEDDMAFYSDQIHEFHQNIIEYRAHLDHKHSEAKFDVEFYKDFDEIEVVVISDYKMKILASKY